MATTARPISTISYNTAPFLKAQLDTLLKSRKISDYRFIHHSGEDGDKDHFHVWVVPNSNRLDAVALREFFNEVDLSSDRPLGCMPFRKSDIDNWLLYVIHDPVYLVAHNSQSDDGKIVYSIDDIISPFPEQVSRDFRTAVRSSQLTKEQQAYKAMCEGSRIADIGLQHGFHLANEFVTFMRNANLRLDDMGNFTASQTRLQRGGEDDYTALDKGLQDIENSPTEVIKQGVYKDNEHN